MTSSLSTRFHLAPLTLLAIGSAALAGCPDNTTPTADAAVVVRDDT